MVAPVSFKGAVAMPRTQSRWRVKIKQNDFFPKLNKGFWADLTSSTEHLRLFAHIDAIIWVASVYNKGTREWIAKSKAAKDSDDAKRKAERIARSLVPGTYEIEWHSIGGCCS